MMNLRQLEILRAVIRHRTTLAAAEELAVSQPAVSNALKAMEAQVGFPLFDRINNRLFPTAEAMTLYRESEVIFALHAKLEGRLRDLRENRHGHLAIMATPPLAYGLLPRALAAFVRSRPQTRLFFDVRRYEGVIEGVSGRVAELGFALGLSNHVGIAHEVVHRGEMVCVMAPDHPLSLKASVTPADLARHPFIGLERGTRLGEALRDAFSRAGVPFDAAVEVRYCNTACVLAGAGVGVAVVDPFSPLQGGAHPVTVHRWFLRLSKTGVCERLAQALTRADRARAGRDASPTGAILDAQAARSGGSAWREHAATIRPGASSGASATR